MRYKHIIWDWNGTLFDDVDACIATMNEMLQRRNIEMIKSRDYYREIFCFPVIDYYKKLGFDFSKESFVDVADEFVDLYHHNCMKSSLMPDTIRTIKKLNKLKVKQTVISASEQTSLDCQMTPFNIKNLFDDTIGIEDNFARSKIDLARRYFENNHLRHEDVLFVGDSIHDYEVSRVLGCDCVLIPRGHQSEAVLNLNGAKLVGDFDELLHLIV